MASKAQIENLDTHETVDCLFNPGDYTIAKSISWEPKNIVGKNVPKMDFTGGGSRTLNVELFFDVAEEQNGNVRTHIDKLWKLASIDESQKNSETQRARPPICLFKWGGDWTFKAVFTSLSVRYTLFNQNGIPVRAVASVTLQEAEDADVAPPQNPTSHSDRPGYKCRQVRQHDTLALISYEEYGDPTKWRQIADANGIEDPLDLKVGQVLSIPALS
jgi:hypothetical protein